MTLNAQTTSSCTQHSSVKHLWPTRFRIGVHYFPLWFAFSLRGSDCKDATIRRRPFWRPDILRFGPNSDWNFGPRLYRRRSFWHWILPAECWLKHHAFVCHGVERIGPEIPVPHSPTTVYCTPLYILNYPSGLSRYYAIQGIYHSFTITIRVRFISVKFKTIWSAAVTAPLFHPSTLVEYNQH